MTNEEIANTLGRYEDNLKSLNHRIKNLEVQSKTLCELTASVKTLATNMEYMANEQEKTSERLERLEREPSENFKHYKQMAISSIITTIIGAVIGGLLTTIIR